MALKHTHTPGPWTVGDSGHVYDDDAKEVALPLADNEEQYLANARLIAEAGTVATETGLTPRQLAEQRAALLEALQRISDGNTMAGRTEWTHADVLQEHYKIARAALVRAAAAEAVDVDRLERAVDTLFGAEPQQD